MHGIRSELFSLYEPLNLRNWLAFVKDLRVFTLSTARAIQIFKNCRIELEEREEELDVEAFGEAVHRLAVHVFDGDGHSCAKLNYLYVLPLVSRRNIRFHAVTFENVEIHNWKENREVQVGLEKIFRESSSQGWMRLNDFQKLLRKLRLVPEHLAVLGARDAFFESLQECTWEDRCCARHSQIGFRKLNLAIFVEALVRAVTKSKLFKPDFGVLDLARLLDRVLFPSRFLRLYRKTPLVSKTVRFLRRAEPNATLPRNDDDFIRFRDLCRASDRRRLAELEVLEYLNKKGKVALQNKSYLDRVRPGTLSKELKRVKRVVEICQNRRDALQHSRAETPAQKFNRKKTREEKIAVEEAPEQADETETAITSVRETVQSPSGFVSLQEHEIVLTKLRALEDALELGGMDELDWDGTLEDAESKLQELVPLMMVDDLKEASAATEKFEVLDKIVRNHKDFREREERKKQEWLESNRAANDKALAELREIYPPCIAEGAALKDLKEIFKLKPALAKRVFQRKTLRLIHMPPERTMKLHIADLTGIFSTQGLDLREMRAVFAALPQTFESDSDGRKAAWRESILLSLQELIKKQQAGDLRPAQMLDPSYTSPEPSVVAYEDSTPEKAVILRKNNSSSNVESQLSSEEKPKFERWASTSKIEGKIKVKSMGLFAELKRKAKEIGNGEQMEHDEEEQKADFQQQNEASSSSIATIVRELSTSSTAPNKPLRRKSEKQTSTTSLIDELSAVLQRRQSIS